MPKETRHVCNTEGDETVSRSTLYELWQILTVSNYPEDAEGLAVRLHDELEKILDFNPPRRPNA